MKNTFKFVLAGALCAVPSVAVACSCAPQAAPKVALEKSAAVFVGRVTSIKKGEFTNTYQFAVSKQWKGIGGATTSIMTANNSAACGIGFEENRDYLVYAYKTEESAQLRTNLCSRTTRSADAAADFAELGAPVKAVGADVTGNNNKPLDMSRYYRVAANGDIQIAAKPGDDPLVALSRALRDNKNARRFRVNWTAPTADSFTGTSLYNRKDFTLKSYSSSTVGSQTNVSSVLYSGVTDEVLHKLSATDRMEDFFRTYAKYGVTKRDLGSKVSRS